MTYTVCSVTSVRRNATTTARCLQCYLCSKCSNSPSPSLRKVRPDGDAVAELLSTDSAILSYKLTCNDITMATDRNRKQKFNSAPLHQVIRIVLISLYSSDPHSWANFKVLVGLYTNTWLFFRALRRPYFAQTVDKTTVSLSKHGSCTKGFFVRRKLRNVAVDNG